MPLLRCDRERVAVVVSTDGEEAMAVCEQHARRAERIHLGDVLWLVVGG